MALCCWFGLLGCHGREICHTDGSISRWAMDWRRTLNFVPLDSSKLHIGLWLISAANKLPFTCAREECSRSLFKRGNAGGSLGLYLLMGDSHFTAMGIRACS